MKILGPGQCSWGKRVFPIFPFGRAQQKKPPGCRNLQCILLFFRSCFLSINTKKKNPPARPARPPAREKYFFLSVFSGSIPYFCLGFQADAGLGHVGARASVWWIFALQNQPKTIHIHPSRVGVGGRGSWSCSRWSCSSRGCSSWSSKSSKIIQNHPKSIEIMHYHHSSSCIILHHPASSCIIMHHHASSCIIMHHRWS